MSLVVSVQAPVVQRPAWIKSDQLSYLGIRHKRTPLPYIITPQTLLRYRTTTEGSVSLRLLNFNNNNEKTYNVTASWQISINHAEGVLFVDSVEFGTHTVEVELGGAWTHLPMYILGETNENAFKTLLTTARFAWLDLRVVSIFVPPNSINVLRNTSVSALYSFYKTIISFYDAFTGLVHDPTMFSINSNTNKQYFIKADSSGRDTAYYSSNWLAMSQSDLGKFLEPSFTNWLVLQTLGDAYNYGFTRYDTYWLGVWSGMLSDRLQYYYQDISERQTLSKIYAGERNRIEEEINVTIQDDLNLDLWTELHKIVFFTWILNSTGDGLVSEMNQSFRYRNTLNVKQPHHWVWLASLCKYDLVPLLYLCHATPALYIMLTDAKSLIEAGTAPPDHVLPHHLPLVQFISFKKCLYPINRLVGNFNINSNKIKEYVETNFTLFSPLQTRQLKISVSFTLTFQIHDMKQIAGDTVTIYDGLDVVAKKVVPDSGLVQLDDITPGVYMVHHPRGRNYFYSVCYDHFTTNDPYLLVHQNTTNVYVRYTRRVSSLFFDEEVILMGLHQVVMGVMYVNGPERRINVYLNNIQCDPFQPQTLFHHITLVYGNNTETQIRMTGATSTLTHGWHKFSNVTRLIINSKTLSCIFLETMLPAQPVRFALTDTGVMLDTDKALKIPDAEQRLRLRVNRHCKWLDSNPMALIIENDVRDNIYLATQDMETARYDRYYPDRVRRVAANYDFMFAGSAYKNYIKLSIRLLENIGTLVVEYGTLHDNFDTTYAGVQIKNSVGAVVLRSVFTGDEILESSHEDFPLCDEYIIQLYHREPNKLSVYKNFKLVPNFNDGKQNVFLKVQNNLLILTQGPNLID
ncbi:enhancin-4 [Trichoplusia ni granulovirus LBIV-12]|uniref:Enhancin-4 n=1 Tax=Trichoplusia ni granulovirus LBIV-12 TaxID=1916701 RepID=A0A1D8QLI4_GVTN|nr:enhancin-4 [Trichoplusia ni granulovirus LBIV-12]AOW41496.1 enhancin-4 [Trichoplusia ni granulovirus LBIV-12]